MSNVLTLLITDVVDSTQLNDQLGDAVMAQLWGAHDRAARELMVTWRGREIARSDGFFVLFDSTSDAVASGTTCRANTVRLTMSACVMNEVSLS